MPSFDDQASFRTCQLSGRAITVIVWIESIDSRWTAAEKRQAEAAVRHAEGWISHQALTWGQDLSFVHVRSSDLTIRLNRLPECIDTGAGRSVQEWIDVIMPHVDWRSPGAFLTQVQLERQVDHAHLLLLVRRPGRSYASPNSHGLDENDALPVATCFFDEGTRMWPSTIAHELLHLYGAWDLYHDPVKPRNSYSQTRHAERLFPRDIMLESNPLVQSLTITDLTAWRLGWLSSVPAWFEYFAPLEERDVALASTCTPPSSFTSQRKTGFAATALAMGKLTDVVRIIADRFRRLRNLLRGFKVRIEPGRPMPAVNRPPRPPRPGPREPPEGILRPTEVEQLHGLDPTSRATRRKFFEVMTRVLQEQSMVEAQQIADNRPSPPGARRKTELYGQLMVEWTTIRRLVESRGAGGIVEERRLRTNVQDWTTRSERIGSDGSSADLSQLKEAYKRSVLILDSIARRDLRQLRTAVFRFRHLERQLRA